MTNLLANSRAALAATDHRAPQQGAAAVRPNAVLAEPSPSGAPAPRFSEAQWRNLLLGGVAAGVAFFGYGRMAYAACATDGTTITCTGDLTAGVAASNPITTFNVYSLTTDITPAAGVHGIHFTSTGDATILSDTGAFEISVSGVGAYGIIASSSGAGAVSLIHTGDIITSDGRGIHARSSGGNVTTVSTGNIHAGNIGIYTRSSIAGAVSVTHTGDITSDSSIGIYGWSSTDNVTTVSTGNIQAKFGGIQAKSTGVGAVSITHTGDITADHAYSQGLKAYSTAGSVTTLSIGNIQAGSYGIGASSNGAGAVSVTHTGDITSDNTRGINASSASGSVTTLTTGDIQATTGGIWAKTFGAGAVSVTHTGDITSDTSRGIFAYSKTGSVTTVSTGTIQASNYGIYAESTGAGIVSVTHTGDITSEIKGGISADSDSGSVTTLSTGNIQANSTGIWGASVGAVSVTHTGDITSGSGRGIDARSDGGNATTLSTGNIQANSTGIQAWSLVDAAVSVTHTGDITSDTSLGIYAYSKGGSVTTLTTGNIQADRIGIYANSVGAGAARITHTGDVTSDTRTGIYASSSAGSAEITVADGVVRGGQFSIEANGATGTTLNLNAGSVLINDIELSGGGASVLNTGPGLSITHTFYTISGGTVPTIGNTSGNVAAVSGNQIAVADISGLTAADNQLSDTLDGVSGVLGTAHARGKGQWWISGFGGTGNVDGSSSAPQADHSFGGFVAGGHTVLGNGMQLGVFGGLSKSVHQASVTNGVRAESSGFFGGLYGGYSAEAFALDFALTAGSYSNDGTRLVANNTVATGLETASSSYDSFFIAPELTVSSNPMAIGGVGFTPSLRVRYELLKSDGFTETGLTSGALTMGSATSHALNMRLQGAFPVELDGSASALTFRTGIDARFATDSGRQATLLGVVSNDAGADNESAGGGFAGLDFTHALSDLATLTATGELQAGTNGLSATANFGIRVQF